MTKRNSKMKNTLLMLFIAVAVLMMIIGNIPLNSIDVEGAGADELSDFYTPMAPIDAKIYLKACTFDPLKEEPGISKDLTIGKSDGYYILQFNGPIYERWVNKVKELGAKFYGYIPDFAFIVRMDEKTKAKAEELSVVRSVTAFHPAYKLSLELLKNDTKENSHITTQKDAIAIVDKEDDVADEAANTTPDSMVDIYVLVFENMNSVISQIEHLDGKALEKDKEHNRIRMTIAKNKITELAFIPDVQWIEKYGIPQPCMDAARASLGVTTVTSNYPNIDGSGVIIAICDTGIKHDHGDFGGATGDRIDYHLYVASGGADDDDGHGTNTSGIALGDGTGNPAYKGIAPNAHLIMEEMDNLGSNADANTTTVWLRAADAVSLGALIQSNSWSQGDYVYGSDCVGVDYCTRDANNTTVGEQPLLIVFAAGNAGPGGGTTGDPGNAKNSLQVGGCSNLNTSATADDTVAASSGRGPTEDGGRIKPDLVTYFSCITTSAAGGYGAFAGTSGSAPMAAGAAALFIQDYKMNHGNANPSPALIKAALINTAEDNGLGYPSYVQGWGKLSMNNLIGNKDIYFVNESGPGLATGDNKSYYVYADSGRQLKITLVWTDPAGTINSGNLVNDLNLVVTGPDGTKYYGNKFTNSWSTSNPGSYDNINNVENVFIQVPTAGKYNVTVWGYNVATDTDSDAAGTTQDYALVVWGDLTQNISALGPHAPITVDGSTTDWTGTGTAPYNNWSASANESIWNDSVGDDNGNGSYTYPSNARFETSCLDLREFRVCADNDTVNFLLKFKSIDNSQSYTNGFSEQMIEILIDKDRDGTGRTDTLRNAKVALNTSCAWEYALWANGNESRLEGEDGTEYNVLTVKGSSTTGAVEISVPKTSIGNPESQTWRFTVLVGAYDDVYGFRNVDSTQSANYGGGGHYGNNSTDGNVYDMAFSVSKRQGYELDRYHTFTHLTNETTEIGSQTQGTAAAIADSVYSTYAATYANDGDTSTGWLSSKYNPNCGWVRIDLSDNININKVGWDAGKFASGNQPGTFWINVSMDNVTYTNVASATGYTGETYVKILDPPIATRYVNWSVMARGASAYDGFGEVLVNGKKVLSPTLHTSSITGTTDYQVHSGQSIAQSFTPSSAIVVSNVSLYARANTASSTVLSVAIQTDSSSKPSGVNISSVEMTTLSTSNAWQNFNFNNSAVLESGKKYWLVANCSDSATNGFYWVGDTSGSYSGGQSTNANAGADWTSESSSIDMQFLLYQSGATLPVVDISHDVRFSHIVINEVNASGDHTTEWVKICNPDRLMNVSMTGYTLTNQDGNTYTFPANIYFGGGNCGENYYIIHTGTGTDGAPNSYDLYMGGSAGVWNDNGEDLLLNDSSGNCVDYMAYGTGGDTCPSTLGWSAKASESVPSAPTSGQTVVRVSWGEDNDWYADWRTAVSNNPLTNMTYGSGITSNDMFGWNVTSADVNSDGYNDTIVGAPYAAAGGTARGSVYIFFGNSSVNTGKINAATANVTISGTATDGHFGWSVGHGKLNETSGGIEDIIIGEPDNSTGVAYIFFGRSSWSSSYTTANANATLTGGTTGDKFGSSVSGAGDVNNDGYSDVIIGAYANSFSKGKAYIYYGGAVGTPTDSTVYVSSNAITYGTIDSFANAQDDDDDYATLTEESVSGGSEQTTNSGVDTDSTGWTGADWVDTYDDVSETWKSSSGNPTGYLEIFGDMPASGTVASCGGYWEQAFTPSSTPTSATLTFDYTVITYVSGSTSDKLYVFIDTASGAPTVGVNQVWTLTITGTVAWGTNPMITVDVSSTVNSATTYYLKLAYYKTGATVKDDVKVGYDNMQIAWNLPNVYKMDIEFDTTNVAEATNYYLQLNYKVAGENFDIMVEGPTDTWTDMDDLTSTDWDNSIDILLNANQYLSGSVNVRFVGQTESGDSSQSTLYIEYHRIRSYGTLNAPFSSVNVTLTGENANDKFGFSVSNAGNVNGDNCSDVIVGAPGTTNGNAYVFYGSSAMADVVLSAGWELGVEERFTYYDSTNGASADSSLMIYTGEYLAQSFTLSSNYQLTKVSLRIRTAGTPGTLTVTLEGNSGSNLPNGTTLASAPSISTGSTSYTWVDFEWTTPYQATAGTVYWICCAGTGTGLASSNCWAWQTDTTSSTYADGNFAASAGAGQAWTAYTTYDAWFWAYGQLGTSICEGPNVTLTGESTGDNFGFSVSGLGDINNDSYDDIIVGAPGYNNAQGRAYIFKGRSSMEGRWDLALTGNVTGDYFGYSVSGAGDLDNDTYNDIIVGAPYAHNGSVADAGAVYIFYGSPIMCNFSSNINYGGSASGLFGFSVSKAGDLDNDGYKEIVVGAPYGSAYILTGEVTTAPALPGLPTISSSTHESQSTWYANDDPAFSWSLGGTLIGWSYDLDQTSDTTPDDSSEGTGTTASYTDKASGTWYFHLRAQNAVGWGNPSHYTIKIDVTAPNNPTGCTESSGATSDTWQNTVSDPSFTWSGAGDGSGSGVSGYYYYWGASDTGTATSYTTSASYDPDAPGDGTFYLRVKTRDTASNNASWTTIFTFKYDGTAPSNPTGCTESGGATTDTWQNTVSDPSFTWSGAGDGSGSGVSGYYYYWGTESGGTATNYNTTGTFDPGSPGEGTFYLRVKTRDTASNNASWTTIFTFKYDGTAPSNPTGCTESGGATTDTWQNTVSDPSFTWSGAGDGSGSGVSGYYYYWGASDTGTATSYTTPASYDTAAPGDGTFYLRVKTRDTASNNASWATIFTFKYDGTAPTNPSTNTSSHTVGVWSTDSTVDVTWAGHSDVTSGIAGFYYCWDTTSNTVPTTSDTYTTSISTTSSALSDGSTWYLHVRAKDNATNLGGSGTVYHIGPFKIDSTVPTANAPTLTRDYDADGSYTISFSASDGSGSGVTNYHLQEKIGTGGSWTNVNSSALTATSYDVSGKTIGNTYYYQVRAKDAVSLWGSWSATSSNITINTNNALKNVTGVTVTVWGGWSSSPGGANINGTGWIRIWNSGGTATQQVNFTWTSNKFTNGASSSWTIPINNNIKYQYFYTNWSTETPYNWITTIGNATTTTSTDSDNYTAFTFNAIDQYLWVQYIIVDMSSTDILYTGSYTCDFTVTAVSGSKKEVKASEEPVVKVEEGQKTIKSETSQVIPIMILTALIPAVGHKNITQIKCTIRRNRRGKN